MSTAFQPNAFQGTGFQIAGGVAATQLEADISITQDDNLVTLTLELPKSTNAAGRPQRNKRRRILVEIDGQNFAVNSEDEAVQLLDQLKEEAQKQANLVIERAQKAIKRPQRKVIADARKSLVVPTIQADPISDVANEISAQIAQIYKDALRTVEIGTLLRKVDEESDDEEALLMLL